MRRLNFAIALTIFLLGSAIQTSGRPVASSPQDPQSAERAESARLTAQVHELYKQGKYDDAIPLAKRVLEIEQAAAPDQLGVAAALSNLAELYFQKGTDSESEKLFQRASLIYQSHRLKTPAASNALERLAQLAFKRRKYQDAFNLLEQSLAIREVSFGKESIPVAETLHEIANVHQANRKPDKAEPLYLRSIKIKEQVLGRANENTTNAMKDYACLSIKNRPLLGVQKGDDRDQELSEAEIEERSIRARAQCWLYGFETDCAAKSYKKPEKPLEVLNAKAVKLAQPPYPVAARGSRISGRVYVAVRIDEAGAVVAATPVCGGHPLLNGAGVEAARASKFTPTVVSGSAVKVTGLIVYNFVAY
jgi:tetratricopeptide (TPR) repeat protein